MSKQSDLVKVSDGTIAGNLDVTSGTIKLDGNYPVGTNNVALGDTALANAGGTVDSAVAVGYQSLYTNSSGSANIAVGRGAMYSNVSGDSNVAIGHTALASNTASNNTAVGFQAGYANTTGYNNLFAGVSAGDSNTTGALNALSGSFSGATNTTGSYNTAYGAESLYSNTTASANTAVGYQAGYTNTTGSYNTFVGRQAGFYSNNTGNIFNAFFGQSAGFSCTTGSENTFIGTNAGDLITTGSKNTILGRYNGNAGGLDIRTSNNNIVLSDGDGNVRFRINSDGRPFLADLGGDAGTNTVKFNTGNGRLSYDTSSARYKDNIRDSSYGLSEIVQMQSRMFEYKESGRTDVGLIAEELYPIIPELVGVVDNQPDSVSYDRLVSVLIKAVQELSAKNDALTARITALEGN
jgi:hypothetical protein